MTRKEEIINYANSFKGKGIENEELKETIRLAIIDGAMWSDENPNMDVFVEKALKFIKTNVDRIVNNQHGVCMGCMDWEFRNYMKGEKV